MPFMHTGSSFAVQNKNVVADLTSLDRETDAALSIRDRSTVRCFEC
jgi:hypothetical protein